MNTDVLGYSEINKFTYNYESEYFSLIFSSCVVTLA